MQNQQQPNENYNMQTTDMNDVGSNPVGSGNIVDVIEATGNINPTRFWMVFMVALTIALGMVIFFGGGYLTDEIKNLKQDNKQLQVKLDECPDKTLETFKKQQAELNELKHNVLRDAMKLDSIEKGKRKTLEKIQKIEKMQ